VLCKERPLCRNFGGDVRGQQVADRRPSCRHGDVFHAHPPADRDSQILAPSSWYVAPALGTADQARLLWASSTYGVLCTACEVRDRSVYRRPSRQFPRARARASGALAGVAMASERPVAAVELPAANASNAATANVAIGTARVSDRPVALFDTPRPLRSFTARVKLGAGAPTSKATPVGCVCASVTGWCRSNAGTPLQRRSCPHSPAWSRCGSHPSPSLRASAGRSRSGIRPQAP